MLITLSSTRRIYDPTTARRTVRRVRFGVALPQYDVSVAGENPLQFDTIAAWAQAAERLGFDSIWLSDHVRWDIGKYGGSSDNSGLFEPIVTLGALARLTDRVRLGTLVLLEALRPPAVLAKSLASLDRISKGRLDVGIGAGWYAPDYTAIGQTLPSPGERIDRLDESLHIITNLLAGEAVEFTGTHHSVHGAALLPPPLQVPRPPVFVGGRGDRLLRLVARHADGWNTCWAMTPDLYRERLAALDHACELESRDPATVQRSLGLYTLVGEHEADLDRRFQRLVANTPKGVIESQTLELWRESRLVGTVQEVRDSVDQWERLGVGEIICGLGALPFQVSALDDLEMLSTALR
jgi:probable F420-dependent oxidoreductase